MKRTLPVLLLLMMLLLSACAKEPDNDALPPPGTDTAAEEGFDPALLPETENANEWTLADFSGCFSGAWETTREDIALTDELTLTLLSGAQDGPTVYLVAGVHGDEVAGWRAGELLKSVSLRAGTLCIASPANTYGAAHDQRRTVEGRDLNRNFPGDAAGTDTARLAAAIFDDIRLRAPVLLFDLHEAHEKQPGRDALGNSLICGSLEGDGELVWALLLASEDGALCASPLTLYASPPAGSLNRAATELLALPSITVETLRTEPLAQRVRNHLEIVQFALQYLEML